MITRAKKSISNFKLREGMPIGVMVTLRGDRMWEFLDRLLNAALPRIRDFNGVSPNSFDGRGNYSLGLREQVIFPEIEYDKIDKVRGMQITIMHDGEDGRRGASGCWSCWECRSRGEDPDMTTEITLREDVQQDAEVRGAAAQPLPPVRAAARLHPQVRASAASASGSSPCWATCRA